MKNRIERLKRVHNIFESHQANMIQALNAQFKLKDLEIKHQS